jgi:hypothetical protein
LIPFLKNLIHQGRKVLASNFKISSPSKSFLIIRITTTKCPKKYWVFRFYKGLICPNWKLWGASPKSWFGLFTYSRRGIDNRFLLPLYNRNSSLYKSFFCFYNEVLILLLVFLFRFHWYFYCWRAHETYQSSSTTFLSR